MKHTVELPRRFFDLTEIKKHGFTERHIGILTYLRQARRPVTTAVTMLGSGSDGVKHCQITLGRPCGRVVGEAWGGRGVGPPRPSRCRRVPRRLRRSSTVFQQLSPRIRYGD